jgi:hypothetical protein
VFQSAARDLLDAIADREFPKDREMSMPSAQSWPMAKNWVRGKGRFFLADAGDQAS